MHAVRVGFGHFGCGRFHDAWMLHIRINKSWFIVRAHHHRLDSG
jgi:hypothetical protein